MSTTLRSLRLWLFALLLAGGQLLALAHATDHVAEPALGAAEPCLVCLATQDLTAAAPPVAPSLLALPVAAADLTTLCARGFFPVCLACRQARAPPAP